MYNSIGWLVLLAVLIFIEILTLGLTTIWFAGGALIAFIVSLVYDNLLLEVALFLIISFILLFFTRPLIIKIYNPKKVKTNYESIIGKSGVVNITIDNVCGVGQVIVDGQVWSAKSQTGDIIEEGTKVVVHDIVGVKLIVSKKEEL